MIDWDRVAVIRDDLGADGFELVLEIFEEESRLMLNNIAQTAEASVQEADFHRLRGGALNLGCAALADLCRTHEHAARAGAVVAAAEVAAMTRICQQSLEALQSQVAGR
jgi:HPt (histidine-containing phosphotransfer) domain-containing protein